MAKLTQDEVQLIRKVSEYTVAYDFEVYDLLKTANLFVTLRPVMFSIIGLYIAAVYCGQMWMKNRKAYKLEKALFLWNSGLCLFSIIATVRLMPELLFLLSKPDGVYNAVCDRVTHNYATSFWLLMVVLSKIVETGDTAFIVLRKQKLIVLHWYHHAATILMTWYGFEYYDSFGRFIAMNTFVHSFMYAYYALRALKVRIPKRVSMALTTLQIAQLVIASYVNFVAVAAMRQGLPCNRDWNFLYLAGAVVGSLLLLFVNFFVNSYLQGRKKKTH